MAQDRGGAQQPPAPTAANPINPSIKTGLILNGVGLGLFLLWLVFQSNLPLVLSVLLALVFCGLLGSSLFYLFRGVRQTPQDPQNNPYPPKPNP